MFVSPAFAQTAVPGGGDLLSTMLPLVLIFVVFYFLLIRPQQKRAKEHRAKIDAIRTGDRVVTGGGILGKVVKIDDAELVVEIADNVRVRVMRGTVTDVVSKPEPASSGGDKPEDKGAGKSEGGLSRFLKK